jgi:hypothetical protein
MKKTNVAKHIMVLHLSILSVPDEGNYSVAGF